MTEASKLGRATALIAQFGVLGFSSQNRKKHLVKSVPGQCEASLGGPQSPTKCTASWYMEAPDGVPLQRRNSGRRCGDAGDPRAIRRLLLASEHCTSRSVTTAVFSSYDLPHFQDISDHASHRQKHDRSTCAYAQR